MLNARPLRGRNAIEAVAFVLQYVRAFDQEELEKIAALKDSFTGESWKAVPMQGVTLQVGAPAFVPQPTANGSTFQKVGDDGKFVWMVRAFNNMIVVNCFDYDRWTDVWNQASHYLKLVANAIASDSLRVNLAVLQITDRFTYGADPEPYDIRDVFRVDSPYLPANVGSSGAIWYANHGWAVNIADAGANGNGEPAFEGATLGNAITVSSNRINNVLTSTIDHVGQIAFDKNHLPMNLFAGDEARDDAFLSSVFCDLLKPNNKTIVRSLLNDAQLNAIGLTG